MLSNEFWYGFLGGAMIVALIYRTFIHMKKAKSDH